MPTVPVAENRVGIADVTGAKIQAADYSGTGLQALGRGLQQLGGAGGELADAQFDISMRHASATAKDGINQVSQSYATRGYNGSDAFFNKGGKDALLARPDFEKALDDEVKGIRAQLKDPVAQTLFDRAMGDQHAQWTRDIGVHVDRETTKYDINQTVARVGIATNAAANAALTNPKESEVQLDTVRGEVEQAGALQNWSPEQIADSTTKAISGARRDIGVNYVNSGPKGAEVAQAYLDKYAADFTADDRAALQTHIRTMMNAQAAEARRAEAERRREEREQAKDAGDRAADADRLIGQGVPLPPAALAQAITDAQKSGRPALVASIKTGAFKNDLTVEHRGDTPAELQNTINGYAARVAKAGNNPNPNDVIALGHLQTLLSNSNEQLRSDPLSWGAAHLKLDVPPLNWSDPGSINQRMSAARTVSSRTGAPVKVLTNEEAASFSPILANGSIADRRGLVSKLASFGSMGASAAAQVAPGNDQFISLIGLATGSNRAASKAHVEMVMSGFEVLKTNPKLIDNDKAGRSFQQHVGPAFELMPSLARGVLANAKAMFASKATHAGAAQWSDFQNEFPAAVDDALGGYRDPEGNKGGIGKWQGRATLLPDGWSQDRFNTSIARATLPQLQKAWNGAPASADGQGFTVGRLKNMQYVAVGDGRYRLTDGSHYVGLKGGGFFEIDVRKLR